MSQLCALFKPPSQVILQALATGAKSLTELAETLQMSRPAASKHLKELAEIGLIDKTKEKSETGRVARYCLNRWSLFVSVDSKSGRLLALQSNEDFKQCHILLEQLEPGEFKEDLKKLVKVIDSLKRDDKPDFIILFGSVARREGGWKSDIDVALLRDKWSKELQDRIESIISELMVEISHQIQPVFVTCHDVEVADTLICIEIRDSCIIIYGNLFGRRYTWQAMERYKSIAI